MNGIRVTIDSKASIAIITNTFCPPTPSLQQWIEKSKKQWYHHLYNERYPAKSAQHFNCPSIQFCPKSKVVLKNITPSFLPQSLVPAKLPLSP